MARKNCYGMLCEDEDGLSTLFVYNFRFTLEDTDASGKTSNLKISRNLKCRKLILLAESQQIMPETYSEDLRDTLMDMSILAKSLETFRNQNSQFIRLKRPCSKHSNRNFHSLGSAQLLLKLMPNLTALEVTYDDSLVSGTETNRPKLYLPCEMLNLYSIKTNKIGKALNNRSLPDLTQLNCISGGEISGWARLSVKFHKIDMREPLLTAGNEMMNLTRDAKLSNVKILSVKNQITSEFYKNFKEGCFNL